MRISKFCVFAALLSVPFLTNCGPSIKTLSQNEIKVKHKGSLKQEVVVLAPPPSSVLVAGAANKPKDKHSMPIYSFSERNRVARTTAYTCSEDDHIVYGSKNAIGTNLLYTPKVRSVAADWSFYPVGTVFRIKGLSQLYVVDDYGSALAGTGTLDLYHPCKASMNAWGRRNVEISVVQWGSFKRSAEILSKRTSYAHCRQMYANILRQRPDLSDVASR